LLKRAVAALLAIAVLVVAVTWGYIDLLRDDAPERLTLGGEPREPGRSASSSADPAGIDGTWNVRDGCQAGYRVKEVLFGRAPRLSAGPVMSTVRSPSKGATVTAGSFTVEMTTVSSDESRRDGQFRGRMMDTPPTGHPPSS
jgi:hypothetical protein